MSDLSKYSYANARIRAMLSYLLDPALFSRLWEAKDIYEVLEILKGTVYKDIAGKFDGAQVDLMALEKEFLKSDLDAFDKVSSSLSTKKEQELVSLFIQRYELEELKTALRIWQKKWD